MQLERWRLSNRLSFREAAELLFDCSPGYLSNIEKGALWPSPQVLIRIDVLTRAIGPRAVTANDILLKWVSVHEAEVYSLTRKALKIAATHKESKNGKTKEKGVKKSTPHRKAGKSRKTAHPKGKGRGGRARRPRA